MVKDTECDCDLSIDGRIGMKMKFAQLHQFWTTPMKTDATLSPWPIRTKNTKHIFLPKQVPWLVAYIRPIPIAFILKETRNYLGLICQKQVPMEKIDVILRLSRFSIAIGKVHIPPKAKEQRRAQCYNSLEHTFQYFILKTNAVLNILDHSLEFGSTYSVYTMTIYFTYFWLVNLLKCFFF